MKNKMSIIIATIFFSFFLGSILLNTYKARKVVDIIIADDVMQLAKILNTIDQECGIASFEHQKNTIDFLNVISFKGSEVGSMNLKYPQKWRGAYLNDNPTIQEKYYQVIKAKDGYWVVPGEGVQLSNGLVIGKQIVFNQDTDMQELVNTLLRYNGRPLALQIMSGKPLPQEQKSVYDQAIARDRLMNM